METCERLSLHPVNECRIFENLERRTWVRDLSFLPIPVPHDDGDNVAYVLSSPEGRAGLVTDLGEPTEELVKHLTGCVVIYSWKQITIQKDYSEIRDILSL